MITGDDRDGLPSSYFPKIVLCVPGTWMNEEELSARLATNSSLTLQGDRLRVDGGRESYETELRPADRRMESAFRAAASRRKPSLKEADFRSVAEHSSVLYVLSANFGRDTAAPIAAAMLRLGASLLEVGGIAVKCDSSGLSHSATRWTKLAAEAEGSQGIGMGSSGSAEFRQAWAALIDAWVAFPIEDEQGRWYSCGMHLLGRPDVQLDPGPRPLTADGARSAVTVMERFALAICLDGLHQASTFAEREGGREYRVVRRACDRYEEDDFFWNRWGYARLDPS